MIRGGAIGASVEEREAVEALDTESKLPLALMPSRSCLAAFKFGGKNKNSLKVLVRATSEPATAVVPQLGQLRKVVQTAISQVCCSPSKSD